MFVIKTAMAVYVEAVLQSIPRSRTPSAITQWNFRDWTIRLKWFSASDSYKVNWKSSTDSKHKYQNNGMEKSICEMETDIYSQFGKNGMRNMVFFFRLFYSFIVQFFVLFVSYHISMDEKEEYNVALKWTQNHFGKHLFTHNIFALHHVSTWDKAEKSFAHFLLK